MLARGNHVDRDSSAMRQLESVKQEEAWGAVGGGGDVVVVMVPCGEGVGCPRSVRSNHHRKDIAGVNCGCWTPTALGTPASLVLESGYLTIERTLKCSLTRKGYLW